MSGRSNRKDDSSNSTNKKQRTKAQNEASRKNGAKSKGPVSDRGKDKSRQNALKHGLTAKFLTPPKDPRNQDQLYEEVHEELINEYDPVGFTAESTVSNLAHDYVQMIRCRQMMEVLQKPKALTDEQREDWENTQRFKRERNLLSAAIARITAKEDFDFPLEAAHILAAKVAALVKQTIRDVRHIDGTAPESDPDLDPPYEGEIETIQTLWVIIQPLRRKLADEEHLTRLFNGNDVASRMELNRLNKLLKALDQSAAHRDSLRPEVKRAISTYNDAILMKLASEPERIMLLERYLRDIERSIERKMKQLQEIHALGSFRENDP